MKREVFALLKGLTKWMAVAAASLMMMCLASCSALSGGYAPAKTYQTVTTSGLTLDIRDDMKLDNSQQNADGEAIEAYACDYYGVCVTAVPSAELKFNGVNDTKSMLSKVATDAGLVDKAELRTRNDITCLSYDNTVEDKVFHYRSYVRDLGYHYYLIEFFTPTEYESSYLDEYEKIVGSARLSEEPPATADIVADGVKLTVDGGVMADAEDDTVFTTEKYMVMVTKQDINVSADQFCRALLQSNDNPFVDAGGNRVTAFDTLEDSKMDWFVSCDDGLYMYHYIQNLDGRIVYICFMTGAEADDALRTQFEEIVRNASLSA